MMLFIVGILSVFCVHQLAAMRGIGTLPTVSSQLHIQIPDGVRWFYTYSLDSYFALRKKFRSNNGLPEDGMEEPVKEKTRRAGDEITAVKKKLDSSPYPEQSIETRVLDLSWPTIKAAFLRRYDHAELPRAQTFKRVIEAADRFGSAEGFLLPDDITNEIVDLCMLGKESLFITSRLQNDYTEYLTGVLRNSIKNNFTFFQHIVSLIGVGLINVGPDALVENFSRIQIDTEDYHGTALGVNTPHWDEDTRTLVIPRDTWTTDMTSGIYAGDPLKNYLAFIIMHESRHAFHSMIFPQRLYKDPFISAFSVFNSSWNGQFIDLFYPMLMEERSEPAVLKIEQAISDNVFNSLITQLKYRISGGEQAETLLPADTIEFVLKMFSDFFDLGVANVVFPPEYDGEPLYAEGKLTKRLLSKALYIYLKLTQDTRGKVELRSTNGEEMLTIGGAAPLLTEREILCEQNQTERVHQFYLIQDRQNEESFLLREKSTDMNVTFEELLYSNSSWRLHAGQRPAIPDSLFPLFNSNKEQTDDIMATIRGVSERPNEFRYRFYDPQQAAAKLGDPNAPVDGKVPLHVAVEHDYAPMIESLSNRDEINVHALNDRNETPLYAAISQGKTEAVKALVKSGRINLDEKIGTTDFTPLSLAVQLRRPDMVKILLDAGANPNIRPGILHTAISGPSMDERIVEVLLKDPRVTPDLKDPEDEYMTPLDRVIALSYKGRETCSIAHIGDYRSDIIRIFLDSGRLHITDDQYSKILNLAVSCSDTELIRRVLEINPTFMFLASRPARDKEATTPLNCALIAGNYECALAFLKQVPDWTMTIDGKSLIKVVSERPIFDGFRIRIDDYGIKIMSELLKKVRPSNADASDAICWAVRQENGAIAMMHRLLETNPVCLQFDDYKAAKYALFSGQATTDVMKLILDRLDPNMQLDGKALVLTLSETNQEALKLVLGNSNLKLDIDVVGELVDGFIKASRPNTEVLSAFFEKYAHKLTSENSKGEIPFLKIMESGSEALVDLCVQTIDPDTKLRGVPLISIAIQREGPYDPHTTFYCLTYVDDSGRTHRLISANPIAWGNNKLVSIFIDKKADLNARDQNGNTPLHYAVNIRSLDNGQSRSNILKILLEHGADQNVQNDEGLTPLAKVMLDGSNDFGCLLGFPSGDIQSDAVPSDNNLVGCATLLDSEEDPRFQALEKLWKQRHPSRTLSGFLKNAPLRPPSSFS